MVFQSVRRVSVDFFSYFVFLLSCYIAFGTSLGFRYFLIPATFVAFFLTLKNRYESAFTDGFSAAQEFFNISDEIEEDE